MKKLRKTLMAGAGAVVFVAAPALAGPAFAQASAAGQGAGAISLDASPDASPRDDLDTRGYTDLELAENAITAYDQVALNAVDPRGNPVRLVVDRESGIVIREMEMRTLPTPSKNQ